MDDVLLRTARLERTLAELDSLDVDIRQWLKRRNDQDTDGNNQYVGRHKTQLEALDSLLGTAAGSLRKGAVSLLPDKPPLPDVGEPFESCRDYDEAVVWLERLWGFFRQKLDQRDTSPLRDVLKAADEVVWSCYHEVLVRAKQRRQSLSHGPAPLPFVAPEYSPAAIESDRPLPPGLTVSVEPPGWDPAIDDLVRTLPMGLLRLPPWCARSPWWLVYIAHEVGHHVQTRLQLEEPIRKAIGAAVSKREAAIAPQWESWANEVFADFFSVLMVGPFAGWSVLQVERGTATRMNKAKAAYPPPTVRLALLVHAARTLKISGPCDPEGFDVEMLKKTSPQLAPHDSHFGRPPPLAKPPNCA